MMITRGVKEWYLASLQNDDHSWSGVKNGTWRPYRMMITRGVNEWYCRPNRMMISRGIKEWYLASLQNDDHSWSKRMVPGVLTG